MFIPWKPLQPRFRYGWSQPEPSTLQCSTLRLSSWPTTRLKRLNNVETPLLILAEGFSCKFVTLSCSCSCSYRFVECQNVFDQVRVNIFESGVNNVEIISSSLAVGINKLECLILTLFSGDYDIFRSASLKELPGTNNLLNYPNLSAVKYKLECLSRAIFYG